MNSPNTCPRCSKRTDATLTDALNTCGCCGLQWKPAPREIQRHPAAR